MAAESLSENSSLQSRFNIALQHYESGKFAEALEMLRDLSQMLPSNSEIQLNLGNVYFKLQNNPQAEAHWKKAVELDPMEANAYLNLGNLYFKVNRFEEAAQQWEICKRVNKQNPSLWLNLGVVYERLGEPEKAMDHYAVFMGMQSGSTDAAKLKQRFDTVRKMFESKIKTSEQALASGNTGYAKELLEKALTSYPGTARIYKTYASLLYQDGDLEPALKYYLKAFEKNPEDAAVLINLGVIYERLGRPVDAVWAYFRASRLACEEKDKVSRRFESLLEKTRPAFGDYLHSAQALYRQGKLNQAMQKLTRLSELDVYMEGLRREINEWRAKVEDAADPSAKAARSYYTMGQDAKANGRLDQALTFFQKYLNLKPHGPEAEKIRLQLAEIKDVMGAVVNTLLEQDKEKK